MIKLTKVLLWSYYTDPRSHNIIHNFLVDQVRVEVATNLITLFFYYDDQQTAELSLA